MKESRIEVPFNVPLNLSLFSPEAFLNVEGNRKFVLGLFLSSFKITIIHPRYLLNFSKLSFSQQHIMSNVTEACVIPTLKLFLQHLQLSTKCHLRATRYILIPTISNNLLAIRMKSPSLEKPKFGSSLYGTDIEL